MKWVSVWEYRFHCAIGFLILVLAFTVTKDNGKFNNEATSQMKTYMKDKYGDFLFHEVDIKKAGRGKKYDELIWSDSGGRRFSVTRTNNNGEYMCKDSYVTLLVEDDFKSYIKDITGEYFKMFKVYHDTSTTHPKEYKTFDDFFGRSSSGYAYLKCTIAVKQEEMSIDDFKDKAKRLIHDLSFGKIGVDFNILLLSDNDYAQCTDEVLGIIESVALKRAYGNYYGNGIE